MVDLPEKRKTFCQSRLDTAWIHTSVEKEVMGAPDNNMVNWHFCGQEGKRSRQEVMDNELLMSIGIPLDVRCLASLSYRELDMYLYALKLDAIKIAAVKAARKNQLRRYRQKRFVQRHGGKKKKKQDTTQA